MPALRQRLGIRSALLATVTLMALVVWDVNRPAGAQWAAASYVAVVRGYQVVGRPVPTMLMPWNAPEALEQ